MNGMTFDRLTNVRPRWTRASSGRAAMTKRRPLEWIDVNGPFDMPDCQRCFAYLCRPSMAEAVASVGIETGGIDIRTLLDSYHANGHREGSDG
jgi:hypothetical protein